MWSCYFGLMDHELMGLHDPPASASWVSDSIGMKHYVWLRFCCLLIPLNF